MAKSYDKFDWQSIKKTVIGVDEVGRGCLAGRVYAAAVILPQDHAIAGLTDSKLLSESRREFLSKQIRSQFNYGIGYAEVEEIEKLNILQASFLAMRRAIEQLNVDEAVVLVDGKLKIPQLKYEQIPLVKGDYRAEPIAAAAIVAKVERDHYIAEAGERHPQYGFAKHKAYATKEHKAAIAKWGPSALHRKTFAGVKEFL